MLQLQVRLPTIVVPNNKILMKLGRIFSTILIAVLSPVALVAQESDPVLMTVAGKDITRSEFEYAFNKNNVNDGQTAEEYLPLFVNFKLKVAEALAQQLDTLASFKAEFKKDRDALAEDYLTDKSFIEDEAHRVYAKDSATIGLDGILKVSQIAIRVPQQADEEAVAKAKAQMDSVYAKLQAGASFEDAAAIIGVKPSFLRPVEIVRGQAYKEFEDAAFALADGEYSAPFRSPAAFHIVKRVSVRPFGSFEQYKEGIMKMLEQQNIRKAAQMKKGFALAQEMGGNLTPEQALAREDSLLESKYPEFGRLMREYYEGLLFFEISNREVWNTGENLDEAHAKFFKKNKKRYKFDAPRFKGAVVHAATQEVLDSAKRHLDGKNTDEYRAVVEKYFVNDSARVIRLELGVYAIGDNKWVDKLAFGQGEGGRAMNSLPVTGLVGKEIAAPESYADVKGAVADDYNKHKEQKWVKKLRKKYKVVVNKDVLKTVNNHD